MRRVLKKHPKAKLKFDSHKNLYVELNGVNLSDEHLLPPTKDPEKAWEMAELSLKMTQNFNRTHPMRAEFYGGDEKKKRIGRRKKNNIKGEFLDGFEIDF